MAMPTSAMATVPATRAMAKLFVRRATVSPM